jgi:hypothetical protein
LDIGAAGLRTRRGNHAVVPIAQVEEATQAFFDKHLKGKKE